MLGQNPGYSASSSKAVETMHQEAMAQRDSRKDTFLVLSDLSSHTGAKAGGAAGLVK